MTDSTRTQTAAPALFLASASPRRVELLRQLGLSPQVLVCSVPELVGSGESPYVYSRRVALAKAQAGWDQVSERNGAAVLGADTEVVYAGQVLGKPATAADAVHMLRRLSGRWHEVYSSVAMVTAAGQQTRTQVTRVLIAALDDAHIERYVASGEPFGKAGAYAIQGHAAAFVERIEGSYSAVMGLPLFETSALLRDIGFTP